MSNVEGDKVRCIYALFNAEHRLIYIGQTKEPERRARNHRIAAIGGGTSYRATRLYRAMREFGIHGFTFQVLHAADSDADATQAEQVWIDYFKAEGDWTVLNDAVAAPPKSHRKFKAVVEQHLERVLSSTPIGGFLPTMAETTAETQACGKTVQRCYEALKRRGRAVSNGRGSRYRRAA